MNIIFRLVSMIILCFFMQVAVAIPVVSFMPEVQGVNVGEKFSVDIVVSDLPVTEGGGFNLLFDPSIVKVTNVSVENSVWTFKTHPGVIDNISGKVTNVMFARFDGVSGNTKLVTAEFEGIGSGQFSLAMEESKTSPFASNGEKLAVQFNKATVNITGDAASESKASGSGSLNILYLSLLISLFALYRIRKYL